MGQTAGWGGGWVGVLKSKREAGCKFDWKIAEGIGKSKHVVRSRFVHGRVGGWQLHSVRGWQLHKLK